MCVIPKLSLIVVVNLSPAGWHHSQSGKRLPVCNLPGAVPPQSWLEVCCIYNLVYLGVSLRSPGELSLQLPSCGPTEETGVVPRSPYGQELLIHFSSCFLGPYHPTQLQLAAESHLMVCQLVRASIKETVSNRVGLQQGRVLTLRPGIPPLPIIYSSAKS